MWGLDCLFEYCYCCGLALVTGTKEQMWDVFQMQRHLGLALVTGIRYQVEEQMCVGGRFAINW